MKRYLTDLLFQ